MTVFKYVCINFQMGLMIFVVTIGHIPKMVTKISVYMLAPVVAQSQCRHWDKKSPSTDKG